MPKSNPTRPLRRGQRPYVDLDPADSLLLRQIAEKLTIAIIKLHNLDVQIQELRTTQTTFLNAFRATLALDREDPDLAEKVKKEMLVLTNHAYTIPK